MTSPHGPLRVGIGGPVGTGKTALMDALLPQLPRPIRHRRYHQRYFYPRGRRVPHPRRLPPARTDHGHRNRRLPAHGHSRRCQASTWRASHACDPCSRHSDLILIESGGDNLAATFSPELADLTIYVIDVSAGDKIPRKGGPGIVRSDLLVINKIDLAPPCRREPGGDGPGCTADAWRTAIRLCQYSRRYGRRGNCRVSCNAKADWAQS